MNKQQGHAQDTASTFEHYGRCLRTVDLFVETPGSGARGERAYRIHPAAGEGWMDMCEFGSGFLLGRMSYRLFADREAQYQADFDDLNIGLMVDGRAYTNVSSRQPCDCVCEGDVFIRNGDPGTLYQCMKGDSPTSGVSVSLPRAMAEALCEQDIWVPAMRRRNSYSVLKASRQAAATVRQLGRRILALKADPTPIALIELESLSLDLLLKLLADLRDGVGQGAGDLTVRRAPPRWQAAVDEAVSILQHEWAEPLTIAGLARRVGINECYLKSMFRERTGDTIAGYLRRLRMQHARDLLEAGAHSVQEVALLAGYANPGKFAQAFRRVHGMAPSALR